MNDWRLWVILVISVGGLLYNIISNYAIRGNELKHIKEAIDAILVRLERLENVLINKKDG